MAEQGKYVVIEGHDGTGKSTQVEKLRQRLSETGIDSVKFSEPAEDDGTEDVPIADALRTLIKNGTLERDAHTNLLLFSAARREKWHQKALPALKLGKWVVGARNYYSTEAYQGYGEGLDLDLIYSETLRATDERYMRPDVAVILSLKDETERLDRISSRGPLENPDTFESRDQDFQSRVNNAYMDIARRYQLPIISAVGTKEEITDRIWGIVEPAAKSY